MPTTGTSPANDPARDGYWVLSWFVERLVRELEACRSLAELRAVEARIQLRDALTAEWRAFNDATLEPLREIARTLRQRLLSAN